MTEIELIEKAAVKAGMTSLLNHGAASCVYSEGCNGVAQDHLVAFAREIALHCAMALGTPPNAPPNASEGCDFCRNPLFAGTKCKNCGRNAPPNGEGTASSTSQAPVKQDCKCPQGMYWHRARIEGNSEGTGTNGVKEPHETN
jgi:hypothetical protein